MKQFRSGIMYVSNVDEIPDGEHWVIVENRNILVPGDERSRTNPGHGYPEHTEHAMTMIVFETKEDMEESVRTREGRLFGKKDYKVLLVRTPRITTHLSIDVEVEE